jgi:BASS family bile acid:Na+ symporter
MIIDVFVPAIVFLLMTVTGTNVQGRQFTMLLKSPLALVGGTVGQILLLPLCALMTIGSIDPTPELAAGLILIAASPGGALSNFYCYLGRLNVPLSLMLTTCSNLVSFTTLPFLLLMLLPTVVPDWNLGIPIVELMSNLALLLLLPTMVGMMLRWLAPAIVIGHARLIRYLSVLLLLILIGTITADQWTLIQGTWMDAAFLALVFTALSAILGLVTGTLLKMQANDRAVLAVEFAVRNLGAAAVIASSTLNRPEFLAFGVIFVVLQFPLVGLVLLQARNKQVASKTA